MRAANGGNLRVVFMLSEAATIGRLDPVVAAIGQGRKYGVCLAPIVWQDLNQPREIFGDNNAKTRLQQCLRKSDINAMGYASDFRC